ncbi:hypothetical protein RhiJN_10344 [Ceratobasidium sp. AG-Ba]|nr:hypothetical protein RhiJN_10344 [Ceratobasidium sp. AG-Ba]
MTTILGTDAIFSNGSHKDRGQKSPPGLLRPSPPLFKDVTHVDLASDIEAIRDVVPEFCRKLSPAGGFWRKFLIPAPAPSPAARSRIPGGIPSGLQELQEWRSSCY